MIGIGFVSADKILSKGVIVSSILAADVGSSNNAAQITLMSEISLKVNTILSELFARNDLRLVDFKLEFGMYEDRLILGDEFTPDGCRIWDASTLESLDKDLFRTGQGNTLEGYLAAATRLGIPLSLHST